MKKWTVMLVPQGGGTTRTLHLYSFQAWVLISTILFLAFSSTFFFQWYSVAKAQVRALEKSNQDLARARAQQTVVPQAKATITEDERAAIEKRVRAEYEDQNAVVTRELSELRDLEETIRRVQKLPPRIKSYGPYATAGSAGSAGFADDAGKGGPMDAFATESAVAPDSMTPPQLIYGMSKPPTDLIVQEINLRTESLQELMNAMSSKQERIDRTPMGWPVMAHHEISSTFGYRRDPFTYRVSFHSGLDMRAPYGSTVRSTAQGVVTYSGYDGDYGNVVHVNHGNGLETWYGHLSERLAEVGAQVSRGDAIGRVGSTGRSTGNHVHYEVRVGGRPVDPDNYIGN